jgi:hypothetical protein
MTKTEEWFKIFEQQKSSRLTIAQFCRKEGFGYSTFMLWKKKIKIKSKPENAFIELKPQIFFEFSVNEIKIQVSDSIDPQHLSLIIAAAHKSIYHV